MNKAALYYFYLYYVLYYMLLIYWGVVRYNVQAVCGNKLYGGQQCEPTLGGMGYSF